MGLMASYKNWVARRIDKKPVGAKMLFSRPSNGSGPFYDIKVETLRQRGWEQIGVAIQRGTTREVDSSGTRAAYIKVRQITPEETDRLRLQEEKDKEVSDRFYKERKKTHNWRGEPRKKPKA